MCLLNFKYCYVWPGIGLKNLRKVGCENFLMPKIISNLFGVLWIYSKGYLLVCMMMSILKLATVNNCKQYTLNNLCCLEQKLIKC